MLFSGGIVWKALCVSVTECDWLHENVNPLNEDSFVVIRLTSSSSHLVSFVLGSLQRITYWLHVAQWRCSRVACSCNTRDNKKRYGTFHLYKLFSRKSWDTKRTQRRNTVSKDLFPLCSKIVFCLLLLLLNVWPSLCGVWWKKGCF